MRDLFPFQGSNVLVSLRRLKSALFGQHISSPLSVAPHALQLFDGLLKKWSSHLAHVGGEFTTVLHHLQTISTNSQPRIVIRHDLDTRSCLLQSPDLLHCELTANVVASWYVRVDEFQYKCTEAKSLVSDIVNAGHEVGLHAAPYIYPDPFATLTYLIKSFEDEFGLSPQSLTIHGFLCSPLMQQRRNNFLDELASRKDSFPLCDTLPGNWYQKFAGDASFSQDRAFAYLDRPSWNEIGTVNNREAALVLIHPCYWGKSGLRTATGEL